MKKSKIYETLNSVLKQKRNLYKNRQVRTTISKATIQLTQPFDTTRFSDSSSLPFRVKGTLLKPGTYPDKRYGQIHLEEETVKSSTNSWVGVNLFKTHETFSKIANNKADQASIDDIIGVITNSFWNAAKNAIEYEADIYDTNIASKIAAGLIKFISVSFAPGKKERQNGYYNFMDLLPLEASLVFVPRVKEASIRAA